jgi:hypothetical protein
LKPLDFVLYFGNIRNMEQTVICFPPLDICIPVSYSSQIPRPREEPDTLQFLKEGDAPDCLLCRLDEVFDEEWD